MQFVKEKNIRFLGAFQKITNVGYLSYFWFQNVYCSLKLIENGQNKNLDNFVNLPLLQINCLKLDQNLMIDFDNSPIFSTVWIYNAKIHSFEFYFKFFLAFYGIFIDC